MRLKLCSFYTPTLLYTLRLRSQLKRLKTSVNCVFEKKKALHRESNLTESGIEPKTFDGLSIGAEMGKRGFI